MLPITNTKLVDYTPTWARFPGYSLLFDNPGDSLKRTGDFVQVACQVSSEPALPLYGTLAEEIKLLSSQNDSLCLLPTESYHVTVFDGGNIGNLDSTHPEHRPSLQQLLEGMPASWHEDHDLVKPLANNVLTGPNRAPIRFRYGQLFIWGRSVVAIRLEPADSASEDALAQLIAERAALSDFCKSTFGFGAGRKFTPHVSLGYFGNEEGADLATQNTSQWDEFLRTKTEGLDICFDSISMFAFTDMATFFRSK